MELIKKTLLTVLFWGSYVGLTFGNSGFTIAFSTFSFSVNDGYVLKSDTYLDEGRLEFVKTGKVGALSTVESRLVVATLDSCGELCLENYQGDNVWKVIRECSIGDMKVRELEMNLNGFESAAGVIFIQKKSLFLSNDKELFNYWYKQVCE